MQPEFLSFLLHLFFFFVNIWCLHYPQFKRSTAVLNYTMTQTFLTKIFTEVDYFSSTIMSVQIDFKTAMKPVIVWILI